MSTSWAMRSASAQARAIAQSNLSSSALLQTQRALIETHNRQLNALIRVAPSSDNSTHPATSALAGTSFAVKDNIDVAGEPTGNGLNPSGLAPSQHDATIVARLRAAGMIYAGRANMAPMAVGATTHNAQMGDCFNPVGAGLTAGGSSGGSASAVAAGMVSIALGTDTMGSVRLPAAYCGIVGFKPTWGHIPTAGVTPLSRWLDHVGVLARSVEDVSHAYRILAANEASAALEVAASSTQLAVPADLDMLGLHPSTADRFVQAVGQLRTSGYTINTVDLSAYPFSQVRRAGLMLCEAELLNLLDRSEWSSRVELPADLSALLDYVRNKSAADLARALDRMLDARLMLESLMSQVDFLILPTAAQPAFGMNQPEPPNSADLTALANLLGAPAISLPLAARPDELPVGLQLIAHRQRDLELLKLASQVERILAGERTSPD